MNKATWTRNIDLRIACLKGAFPGFSLQEHILDRAGWSRQYWHRVRKRTDPNLRLILRMGQILAVEPCSLISEDPSAITSEPVPSVFQKVTA